MKKGFYILVIFCLFSGLSFAQNRQKAIIDEINTPRAGQGQVKVMEDENVQQAVIPVNADRAKEGGAFDSSASYTKTRGFKIQVFSGNNPTRSRREAESKQAQVRNAFPELETIVTYNAPVWRLRVGNFVTREEADEVLKEMKKTFPGFGKEMYVVPDVIKRHAE